MDSNEFWCRAFLAAMKGSYAQEGTWSDHNVPAAYCEEAAHAALAAAQRCGMATAGDGAAVESPAPEAVEFTAERAEPGLWALHSPAFGIVNCVEAQDALTLDDGTAIHIKWGESCPPKPIEVWLERKGGGA